MRHIIPAALLVMLLIVGCGDDGPSAPAATAALGGTTAGTGSAVGPGLSVTEALATTAHGPLLVRGYLVASGEDVRLCEVLRESLPPQCGGTSLTVAGLDLAARDDLDQAGGVRWSAREVMLLGDVADGTLTVNARATS